MAKRKSTSCNHIPDMDEKPAGGKNELDEARNKKGRNSFDE